MPIPVTLPTQLFCYTGFTVSLSSIFTPLMIFLNIFALLKMLNLAFFPAVTEAACDLELDATVASLSLWELSLFSGLSTGSLIW